MPSLRQVASLLLVLLGGAVTLGLLRRLGGWVFRRDLQIMILVAPIVSLTLGLGGLHHFVGRACFMSAPTWDYTLGVALPLIMGIIALGGLGLGVIRLVLLAWVMARGSVLAEPQLQALADALVERLQVARPQVRLCSYGRPLAITYGLWQPTVLLSTWMIRHLDRRELEAVLAHEIGHVARRDYFVIWLATVLRDAFCYLPTSWAAYRQLQYEKELACDELAVRLTRRPLALASALTKVWQPAVEGPHIDTALSLLGADEAIEGRITRLLDAPPAVADAPRPRLLALGAGIAGLIGLVALQAVNLGILLAPWAVARPRRSGGRLHEYVVDTGMSPAHTRGWNPDRHCMSSGCSCWRSLQSVSNRCAPGSDWAGRMCRLVFRQVKKVACSLSGVYTGS